MSVSEGSFNQGWGTYGAAIAAASRAAGAGASRASTVTLHDDGREFESWKLEVGSIVIMSFDGRLVQADDKKEKEGSRRSFISTADGSARLVRSAHAH
jgi:hypothetical protein